MPLQCTYGTQVKAGAPAYIWIAWNGFLSWLVTHYSRLGPLTQIWFADAPMAVTDMCAAEPVIPSFPTVLQWLGAFNFNPVDTFIVSDYLRTLFISTLWTTVCECAPSGSGGTCEVGRASGAGGWLTSNTGGTAFEEGTEFSLSADATIYAVDTWISTLYPSSTIVVTVWDTTLNTNIGGGAFTQPGTGYRRYTLATPVALNHLHTYMVSICEPAGVTSDQNASAPTNGSLLTFLRPTYTTTCGQRPNNTAGQWNSIQPVVCVGGPPSGTQPPYTPPAPQDPTAIPDNPLPACSTTGDLCNATTRLLAAIATAERQVNWLQSTVAPTCWGPLTPVTGLTGTGTLAVSDVVGLYVQASVPGTWGKTAETPPRYIPEIGSVQFETDGAATKRYGLHYAAENVLDVAPSTNSIRYNVRGGVTLSITPLGRCK